MHITVNQVRLFFDVEGAKLVPDGPSLSEKPTLILLHGGPGFDHSSFKPYFSQFADLAQVLYLDHRGNGRCDRGSPQDWTLNQWADDVAVFCEVLGIEKPIVLGHSFGGMVAMAYATRHPHLPGGLILSSTSARHTPARMLARFEQLGGQAVREAAGQFWQDPTAATWAAYTETVLPWYGRNPWPADAFQRIHLNLEVLFHFARDEFRRFNLLPDLHQVRCPTLVLLDDLGLIPAIEHHVERQNELGVCTVEFRAEPLPERPPVRIEIACYRVVQESLTNALRHARPNRVTIELAADDEWLQLRIRDNGRGFDVEDAWRRARSGGSFGLLGMEERVKLTGGGIEIMSEPGRGAEVHAWFPLRVEFQ